MNPLDLRGPEFLQFCLVYGLAGFTVFWILRAFRAERATWHSS